MQSGFGRTGEYFCGDGHFDVVSDILVVAKGIANGFPLSAIASRKELTDLQVCVILLYLGHGHREYLVRYNETD